MRAPICWLLLFVALQAVAEKPADFASRLPAAPARIDASENTVINYTGAVPATFSGALDADDSTYNRPVSCAALSGVGTAVAHDTVTINNPTGSAVNFVVTSTLPGGGACGDPNDTFFTLYNTSFNPASPLTNCLAINDDISGAANRCSTLSFSVPAGATRILAVAGFNNAVSGGLFSYDINFTGTAAACGTGPVANGNDAGAGSLRQAIADACPGDTITFAPAVTTVTLTSAELAIAKDLTITGANTTITRSAAGGTPLFRLFHVTGVGNDVVLNNLVLTNGDLRGVAVDPQGGAVRVFEGSVVINNSTLSGNFASEGGAIAVVGSTFTLRQSSVLSNTAITAAGVGGGLIATNTGNISLVNLENCTFGGNQASDEGGAVALVLNTTDIRNCTFANNAAGVTGGGIYSVSSATTLRNTLIAGNTAPTGPDYFNQFTSAGNNLIGNNAGTVINTPQPGDVIGTPGSPINPRLAPLGNYGGATQTYALLPGSPAINAGLNAGAPAVDQRGNVRPQQATVDIGAVESQGFTLSTVSGTPQSTNISTAFAAPLVVGIAPVAPGEPVNGGQVTFTAPGAGASATLATSPATIAGGQASVTATANATAGSYNVTAAASGGGAPVSFALTNNALCVLNPVVVNTADAGAGSLRQAIADACVGSTITFDPVFFGVARTITLTSGQLAPARSMNIQGPGANLLTLSGNNASRVLFNVGIDMALSAVTISGGNGVGGGSGFGGAMRHNGGVLTLSDAVFTGSTCSATSGALSSAFASGTITRTAFVGNNCGNVGALYLQDVTYTIRDSTIAGNVGSDAVRVGSPSSSSSVTMVNVTLVGNTSPSGGSALRSEGAAGFTTTLDLTNVTISGNTTTNAGAGGALIQTAGPTHVTRLRNTIVSGNTVAGAPMDVSGTLDPTSASNLIGTGGGLVNGVNGNIVGINNPRLAVSGNYGGPTPTAALLPGSPAIDAGTAVGAPATDQRGIARPQLAGIDIGAFESRGFALTLATGTPQSGPLNAAFTAPLVVGVTANAAGEPVNGGLITYTAPGAGASAALATNPATIAGGQASVNATANGTPGSYNVTAATIGASGTPTFALTNVRTIDLGMTLTDNPDPVIAGNQLTYLATLGNAGPNDALDVSITLPLPAGTTFVSSTPSAGAACVTPAVGANGSIVCTWAGPTPVGTPRTLTVVALVGAAVANGTVLSATAVAAGTGTDTSPGNNSATATTVVNASVDLSITKTDGSPTEIPGTTVVYTMVVANAGPSVATGATVTDNFPAEVIFCSWTCGGSGGGTCAAASGQGNIAQTVNLPALGSVTYTATCTILPGATGNLVNTAVVAAPAGITDPVPGNNSATDTDTLVPTIDLEVFKFDDQDTDVPGTSISYTILVGNFHGPSNAVGTTVTDILPANLTGVTWTCAAANGATCTAAGTGNINDVVNLPVAGEAMYTVNATIAPSATGILSNTASAALRAGETDPDLTNSTSTDTTTLTPEADVSITLTDAPDPVVAGTNLTYVATATNNGPSDAQAVAVSLPLPANTTLVSATPGAGGTCVATACTFAGATAPGASRSVTYVVLVAASVAEGSSISATATASSATTDPNAANNSASTTTAVIAQADLALTFTGSVTQAVINVPATFTAASLNLGPSDAQNVSVTITLTPDFRYAGHTAAGATCTTPQIGNTGAIVCTWAGATAPGVTRTLVVTAFSNTEGQTAVSASTTSNTTDPVANNNVGNLTVQVGYLIEEIPTLSGLGLLLMGLMFGLIGFAAVRRQA